MKKINIFIIILILLSLVAFISIKIWLNTLGLQGSSNSDSIKQSKEIGAFIAKYNIESIDNIIIDSLNNNKSYNHFLDTTEFWIERGWNKFPKYVFFHPIQFENRKFLLFKNPSNIFTNNPELGFVLEGESSLKYKRYQSINKIFIDSIKNKIVLDVYWFKTLNPKSKFLGKIILKRQ